MLRVSLSNPVDWVRLVAWVEGVSFLLLLGIAMPLKYGFGQDLAVKIAGSIHGALFVILGLLVLVTWLLKILPFRHAVLIMIASLLPFGPFLIDRKLVRESESG